MAHEIKLLEAPFEAERAMSEKYVAVEIGTNADQVDLPDGNNDKVIGIIQNTVATAGDSVNVCVAGISKAVAGAAFSKGDYLVAAITTGRLITCPAISSTWTGTPASTEHVIAIALEAAGAGGDIVSVLIRPLVIAH
ncbi:MAG: capsid cement protein [Parcubacteria group bacterium]|jgi:hypothetical protein